VAGKLVAGKLVAGKLVAGKLVAGKLVAGKLVADSFQRFGRVASPGPERVSYCERLFA